MCLVVSFTTSKNLLKCIDTQNKINTLAVHATVIIKQLLIETHFVSGTVLCPLFVAVSKTGVAPTLMKLAY